MSHERYPNESDADYVERLLNAGIELPPGRYVVDRPVRLGSKYDLRA